MRAALAATPGAKVGSAEAAAGEPNCLVRAVGAKLKVSTLVTAKNYTRFMQSYGNILKVSLDSLKKREKKKSDIEKKKPQKKASGAGGKAPTST